MSGEAHQVVLIGGGGHAVVVAEAARRDGVFVAGFLDDEPHAPLADGDEPVERLGGLRAFTSIEASTLHIAVGGIGLRRELIEALEATGRTTRTIIDPATTVMRTADLGRAVLVAARAVVQARAVVGAWCIINTGSIVEHDCVLGENVHVAPGAVLGGGVHVGQDTLIGLGSCVLPGVTIGSSCVVGAGAAVTVDVPDGTTVVGVPAHSLD